MMKQQLAALAVEAATMVARGEDEVFDFVAERAYELFGADGGVGFAHVTDDGGALEIRVATVGCPRGPAWWSGRRSSCRRPRASSR